MIGVLTHHWAKTNKVDEARKLLDRNGEAQSKAPGFVNRQTLYSQTDPTKITTLVVWTSTEIYDAWRASPARAAAMSGADALWSKPPESERFEDVVLFDLRRAVEVRRGASDSPGPMEAAGRDASVGAPALEGAS